MIQIIATIGPSILTKDDQEITKILVQWQKDNVIIIRFNLSHYNDHSKLYNEAQRIQNIIKNNKLNLQIMFDTRGPEIRVANLKNPIFIQTAQKLDFSWSNNPITISLNQDLGTAIIEKNTTVFIDDGKLEMKVLYKDQNGIQLEALNDHMLENNKKIIFNNCAIKLNFLTLADLQDLKIVKDLNIDILALSFVSNKNDINYVKSIMDINVKICSKIENIESTLNLEEIIQNSDMVMVARGDLALEIGFENVPYIQQQIINIASKHSIPAIVATQLLESSLNSRFPSRSDISDISLAIRQNYQFLMLSAETSIAPDPNIAPKIMNKVIHTIKKQKMHMIE